MARTSCIVITDEIKNLASQLQGETPASVAELVGLWQEQDIDNRIELYPTLGDLTTFRDKLRNDLNKPREVALEGNSNSKAPLSEQARVDIEFDSTTRRDRVSLIARLFSEEVSNAMQIEADRLEKRILSATDSAEANDLRLALSKLDRRQTIDAVGVTRLFDRVKQNIFDAYVNAPIEDIIEAEYQKLKGDIYVVENYSDDEIRQAATDRANYNRDAYEKVSRNYWALVSETSHILLSTEGLRIDPNYELTTQANLNEVSPDGISQVDEFADDLSTREEQVRDGWQINYKHISAHETLSQAVRKVIRTIPRLDYEGYVEVDDLGFERYLEPNYVHAVLIDKLRNMTSPTELIPMLNNLARTKVWVSQVAELLEHDETLFSQFYQDFRKDFLPYRVQTRTLNSDGTYSSKTVNINKPEGVHYLLNEWRDNYESGSPLDTDSVYDTDRNISVDNARIGLKLTQGLINKFNNLSTAQVIEQVQEGSNLRDIVKVLSMVGVTPNISVLETALTTDYSTDIASVPNPIHSLLNSLNIIFSGISKGELSPTTDVQGRQKRPDLINTFGSAYNNIAQIINTVTEDAIESSVVQGGRSYYSHVTPSYLGKLIKRLKNSTGNEQAFRDFIENQYGQYQWFRKDGRWRNDWLRQIVEDKSMRDALDHDVVLSTDNITYMNWDDLDYTTTLLTEYFSEPDNNKKAQFAWYHVPILSDSPSAEFIRFRRYRSGQELGIDGQYLSYQNILTDKFVDLVEQEFDRMKLVSLRDRERRAGNNAVTSIANFDIVRDDSGRITNIGGAEFKFIPQLNNFRTETGESFAERLSNLANTATGQEVRDFIRNSVSEIIESGFEQTYADWSRIGLLDEVNGKLKYLNFTAPSINNESIARTLYQLREPMGDQWTSNMDYLLGQLNSNLPVDDRFMNYVLAEVRQFVQEQYPINQQESILNRLEINNPAKEALREYYWNSKFATSQIIQLTTTDLAYYINQEDFQKRYKEVHSPALKLNTLATFKGEQIGREFERTLYLADDEVQSSVLSDINEVLQQRVREGLLTSSDANTILSQYKKVNVADAQAYRTLSSYRAVMGMAGQWTEDMQRAYENFKNGNWDIRDFNTLWQPIKPFAYTQVPVESGLGDGLKMKMPVQHKNAEYLLLAAVPLVAGPLANSPKLKALADFMEENNIDVIQFESTTKVGKQGVVDINSLSDYSDVKNYLRDATHLDGVENPNVVHTIPYEDYGIQQAVPEHAIDANQLVGTQARGLITADISENATINVADREMNKREWLDTYNAINVENLIADFQTLEEMFGDRTEVEKVLLDEIRNNERYGNELLSAVTLNEDGEFRIPLYDPVTSQLVQSLLNSIIRSRTTRQKIKGGSLVQVSNYGLSDDLKIVFEGEGANKRIKYFETYMPWYTREFLEPLMNPDTHTLDINKVPEDLRQLIGYRIPTEDKYSILPLYIKGFLPQQSGGAIMLPSEITTISGSDFDVDKLYVMIPQFQVKKSYDRGRFVNDYISSQLQGRNIPQQERDEMRKYINDSINSGTNSEESSDARKIYNAWLRSKESYRNIQRDRIEKVKYNYDLSPQENSRAARDNAIIDMMWGVLTNSDTASKILKPGGFDDQIRIGYITSLLNTLSENDLRSSLGLKREDSIFKKLNSMNLGALRRFVNENRPQLDPLSPRTQVLLHQQNMTGAKLIGVFANHNKSHAWMQQTSLALSQDGSFKLNGKTLTSLARILNDEGQFISNNNAGYLAASVDNVKVPVLNYINLNTFTADAGMLLSRLGYTPTEVGLLLSQPIVKDMTTHFNRESRNFKDKRTIINEVLTDYREKAQVLSLEDYSNYAQNNFYVEELANNILIEKEARQLTSRNQTSDYDKVQFFKNQLAVGYLFARIMRTADALSDLVQSTRADTTGGGAGPSIADTQSKIQRVNNFLDKTNGFKYPLMNAKVIRNDIDLNQGVEGLRNEILNSPIPIVQAFYTLGVQQTERVLSPYFPHYRPEIQLAVRNVSALTKSNRLDVRTLNQLYNDLLAFRMSGTEFFGQQFQPNGNIIRYQDKRDYYIKQFPAQFQQIVKNNADIAELEFIKRLVVVRAGQDTPVDQIVFRNVGSLSAALKERYSRDWSSLLYMNNEAANQLALDLFRYNFFRNGLAFGPSSFAHLAPNLVREATPEYISTLRSMTEASDDYRNFTDQFVRNHLDKRQIVPELNREEAKSIIDENGEFLDTYTGSIFVDTATNETIIKDVVEDPSSNIAFVIPFEYFTVQNQNEDNAYYRLREEAEDVFIYDRIFPLGSKNNFVEYEYTGDPTLVESVLPQNYKVSGTTESYLANQYDAMPIFSEYDGSMIDGTTYTQNYVNEVLAEAFESVYDANFNAPIDEQIRDILDYDPNAEYEDAQGNKICGAETLFSI